MFFQCIAPNTNTSLNSSHSPIAINRPCVSANYSIGNNTQLYSSTEMTNNIVLPITIGTNASHCTMLFIQSAFTTVRFIKY